jgi:hypothetical protein
MDVDAGSHGDGAERRDRRLTKLVAAGGVTAALTAGLLVSGGLGYAATAVKKGAGGGPPDKQYGDTRPGWGCGDKNHVHTGPPGRQYAPRPPGCNKNRDSPP